MHRALAGDKFPAKRARRAEYYARCRIVINICARMRERAGWLRGVNPAACVWMKNYDNRRRTWNTFGRGLWNAHLWNIVPRAFPHAIAIYDESNGSLSTDLSSWQGKEVRLDSPSVRWSTNEPLRANEPRAVFRESRLIKSSVATLRQDPRNFNRNFSAAFNIHQTPG